MNPDLTAILDRALVVGLATFLATFLLFLAIGGLRSRRRSRPPAGGESARFRARLYSLSLWSIRKVTASLLGALACGAVSAVVYGFVPLPFLDNVVTSSAWQRVPLRLTAVQFERTYEGFTLEGEVWNQTVDPIVKLKAQVEVVATDDKPLALIISDVLPDPLEAGRPGVFQVEYLENSPFIKGYKVSFLDEQGGPILHLTGFDVQ